MKRLFVGVAFFGVVALVAYLSTLGCCQLMGKMRSSSSIDRQMHLTPEQKQKVASMEQDFLLVKERTCGQLCAKRAQIIQLLKAKDPDPAVLNALAQEVGEEQIALEKATLSHIVALRQVLEPSQVEQLTARMTEELRTACGSTACGMTPGCTLKEKR